MLPLPPRVSCRIPTITVTMSTMQPDHVERELEAAVAAAHKAGALLLAAFGHAQQVRFKGEIDLVTEADEAAEAAIVRGLRDAFPTDSVLAEEGTAGGQNLDRLWIVDPLDGTTNFAH